MKHKFSFVVTLWWVLLCALAGFFLLVTAHRQPRRSDSENRMLAGYPELSPASVARGDFMSGFEAFLSDGFFGRERVIGFTRSLLDRLSTLSQDDRLAMEDRDMERRLDAELAPPEDGDGEPDTPGGAPEEAEEDDPEDDAADLALPADAEPITAENSYIWLDRVDGGRKLVYTYKRRDVETYAGILRQIKSLLPRDGALCFTQVPLSALAHRWLNQRDVYRGWGSTVEAMLEDALGDAPGIYVFNVYDILEPDMTGDIPMFYATDHHWTVEAACRVCARMLERQGLPVIPYEEYAYKSIRGKRDSEGNRDTFNALYPLLPGHSYIVTDGDRLEEISLMDYDSTSYSAIINGTQLPWRRIVTGANTGRRALVICDSFGNALAPFLLPYYDEVHMCDFRESRYSKARAGGNISQMMKRYDISDVYVVTSTANGIRKPNSLKYLPHFLTY